MSNAVYDDPQVIEPAEDNIQFEDYFSYGREEEFVLPDGRQTIKFQVMNEGQRARYQRATDSDIKIDQRTQQATLRSDLARQRHALIEESVTDWTLLRRGPGGKLSIVPFSKAALRNWLELANPKIVSDLEAAITKANPWMTDDMAVEDIQAEIDRLEDLKKQKVEREAGKETS